MPEYRISVGNSTTGPIGFVARLTAKNPEAALAILQDHMPEYVQIMMEPIHLNVYFNPDGVTIDDVEEDI